MSAAPWVLLRGLTRDARHWGEFPSTFAHALGGATRVITLDLPGNGALHAERSPTRVAAMAAHCRAELQRQRIAVPVNVLAMSLGAMVATAWAMAAAEEISTAVLINTSMRPFNPWWQRLRPAACAVLLRLALTQPDALAWERTVLRLTSQAAGRDDGALLRDWVAYRTDAPVSAANTLRQLWAAARFRAPARHPFQRLLLLGSEGDRLVDARCTPRIAQRWSCDASMHAWAGHDLPLDDPAWVAQQVREHV